MAVNVGASVFNNWRNNKQSHKLQEKQQEFARAAAERNKQRMWQLMREGQELALEMEHETHKNRLKDIRNDFDNILHRLAYIEAIKTWPLKVLPIVMKNQSLGSLTTTADENIVMHCIFTPSNCTQFNKHILPTIEEKLAYFCNLHWSTLSSHPILFYSGAWKTGTIPTGVEVSQLKTNLSNLPTLLITPFFEPEGGIVFQINAWGIGVELETEIECADFSYAKSYKQGIDYLEEEDIKERTIEEFIPYLQCLIGYIADQYFWTNHNESPLLPSLLAMKVVNTDGMQYLNTASEERYSNLLDVCVEESQSMPFSPEKMLSLLDGSSALWDDFVRKDKLEEVFVTNVQGRCENKISSMKEALSYDLYSKEDLPFLRRFIELYQYNDYKEELSNIIGVLESIDFDYSILESTDITYLEQLVNEGNGAAMFRLGEIYEYSIGVDYDGEKASNFYSLSLKYNFILAVISFSFNNDSSLKYNEIVALRNLCDIHVESAIVRLSQMLYTGFCMPKDIDAAVRIIEDIYEPLNPYTYYWGAKMVIDLYGTEQKESIEKLICQSANMGHVSSQLLLIDMYQRGYIIDKDPAKAALYAKKAAEQGCIKAITKLGIFYIKGFGVSRSIPYGKKLLEISSKHNDIEAINYLKQY